MFERWFRRGEKHRAGERAEGADRQRVASNGVYRAARPDDLVVSGGIESPRPAGGAPQPDPDER